VGFLRLLLLGLHLLGERLILRGFQDVKFLLLNLYLFERQILYFVVNLCLLFELGLIELKFLLLLLGRFEFHLFVHKTLQIGNFFPNF
jgi:hypothetical protein